MSERIPEKIYSFVKEHWGGSEGIYCASAPGRVNLIGEHTDYNDGFVMPAAINLRAYVAGRPRYNSVLHLVTLNYEKEIEVDLNDLDPPGQALWWTYVAGPAYVLKRKNYDFKGFDLVLYGEVPPGGGLSSSASVEVAVTALLNEMFALGMSPSEIVSVAKESENVFSGVPCGVMDQMASVFGQKGAAIFIDCRTLERSTVKIPYNWKIVVCDTGVRHELGASEYTKRQTECGEAVEAVRTLYPEVVALRDVTLEMLESSRERMSPVAYRRARYVIEENLRVLEARDAIEKGDKNRVFKLFKASHEGLSSEYEVSCPELDVLAELAWDIPGVVGARMTGGGFGGNTVNLVEENHVHEFVEQIEKLYREKTGKNCIVRTLDAEEGVKTWKIS